MAVLEKAAAGFEGVEDLLGQQSRAERLVAAAETLGDGHDVGGDALLLAGMQGAGAAHAAHHLVEDQQHAVCVADLADALEIAGRRGHREICDTYRSEEHTSELQSLMRISYAVFCLKKKLIDIFK